MSPQKLQANMRANIHIKLASNEQFFANTLFREINP